MTDPRLTKEDLTKKVIDQPEMAEAPEEVKDRPIMPGEPSEVTPIKDQVQKDSNWIDWPRRNWRSLAIVVAGIALVSLIPY